MILDVDDVLVQTSVGIISVDLVKGMLETNAITDPWVLARVNTLIESLLGFLDRHPRTAHFIDDVALGTNQGVQSKLLALETIDYTENRAATDPFDGVAGVAFREIVTNAVARGSLPFCAGFSDTYGYRRRRLDSGEPGLSSQEESSESDRRQLGGAGEKAEEYEFEVGEWFFEHPNQLTAVLDRQREAALRISFEDSPTPSLRIKAEAPGEIPLDFRYTLGDTSADSSSDLRLTRSTLLDVTLRRAYEQFIKPGVQEEDYPDFDCQFAGPPNEDEFAWIKVHLGGEVLVNEVSLYNVRNGGRSSLVEGSVIYVGD